MREELVKELIKEFKKDSHILASMLIEEDRNFTEAIALDIEMILMLQDEQPTRISL